MSGSVPEGEVGNWVGDCGSPENELDCGTIKGKFGTPRGGMAEWTKAAVSKTVVRLRRTESSNLSSSATFALSFERHLF